MNPETIDAQTLSSRLSSGHPPVLIDVRPAAAFARGHVPGAVNRCVFEVGFLEGMPSMAPGLAAAVCVYGQCDDSQESRMAAEKLCRNGYSQVSDFRGGVEAWSAGGLPITGLSSPPAAETAVPDGRLPIDLEESRIRWTGRNLLNMHEGFLSLRSGHLDFQEGALKGGEFVIDMHTIRCADLAGNPLHEVLVRHLMDHDFFDVALYPEARFVITEAAALPGVEPGAPGLSVCGILTLKDVTAPVSFLATHGITADGKAAAQASFSIDRTRWNVKYGSGRLFRNLGAHLVNDLVELQLRIVTL